jgi:hypothetical protein
VNVLLDTVFIAVATLRCIGNGNSSRRVIIDERDVVEK